MKIKCLLIVTVLVTIYVTDLVSSQETSQNGNPETSNNNTSLSDTTNSANTIVKPAVGNAGKVRKETSVAPPNRRPNRRRNGRRRLRRRRKNKNGKQNSKRTNGSTAAESTTKKQTVVNDIFAGDATNEVAAMKRDSKPIKTSAGDKPAANTADQSDSFFDLWNKEAMTTTVSPDSNAPPPTFDPNKKPGNKTLPVVDPSKSMAHDGRPCNETYQPHETIKTKYVMKYAEGGTETLDCPPNLGTGLVWRQDLCSCGEELVPQDPNDWCGQLGYNPHDKNRHKYLRRHHGADAVMECAATLVWSQEKCQCIYDPTVIDRPIEEKVTFACKTILKLQFEGNLTNSADGYFVQIVRLNRRGRLPRIRFMHTRGASNKAAMIVSQPLEFQAFRGNDFQTQVTYSINFKISPRHRTKKQFMTLLSDECLDNFGRQNKERKPSFSLTFQPLTKSFRLQFRTDLAEVDQIIKGAEHDRDEWYRTVVYFEDAKLNLETNGRLLFTEGDIYGKIPQNKCPLFIAGRGPGFDRSQDFYGYMDNVFLIKDCKFHEANIKFL